MDRYITTIRITIRDEAGIELAAKVLAALHRQDLNVSAVDTAGEYLDIEVNDPRPRS